MYARALVVVASIAVTSGAMAAISITPAAPASSDVVTITVTTNDGQHQELSGDSIVQNGNTFVVQQSVRTVCLLPGSRVTSQFQVGPLPPGSYDIVATTIFEGIGVGCSPPPFTQATSFAVAAAPGAPSLDWRGLFLLAAAVTAVAAWRLKG